MPDPITMTGQYAYACDPYTQVRILCVDRPGEFPVVAMNDRGDVAGHKAMLHDSPNDYDLIPLQVRRKPVEVWMVEDAITGGWYFRRKEDAAEWQSKTPGARLVRLVEAEDGK